jgi:hypothetical protein
MKCSSRLLCYSIVLTAMLAPQSSLHAQASGVCLYESKSYSEGASICARRSLMFNCSASGGRMVWTIVTDQDMVRLCASQPGSRFHVWRARAVSRNPPPAPMAADAAKCFQFNGRKYCE